VQAFYDMALISWSKPMKPLLPLVARPLAYPEAPVKGDYAFGTDHPVLADKSDLEGSAKQARETIAKHHGPTDQPSKLGKGRTVWDKSNEDEAERLDKYDTDVQAITEHLSELRRERYACTAYRRYRNQDLWHRQRHSPKRRGLQACSHARAARSSPHGFGQPSTPRQ